MFFFFFQAEDGIRDLTVTGVQTCALPISIRLAALMGTRVIHVMTHDSIGLGEDGPTHQPVEHLAALRAIPNLNVYRPCDAAETVECWQLAIDSSHNPSVLALTRQNLPQLRRGVDADNRCAAGAYEIAPAQG